MFRVAFHRGGFLLRIAYVAFSVGFPLLAVAACGGSAFSPGADATGQAGQNADTDADPGLDAESQPTTDAGPQPAVDADPQALPDAAPTPDGSPGAEAGRGFNPNAIIKCSMEECKPGPEICCMQNSNELPDFCVGGPNQPSECKSDLATVTVLECDDGQDCDKAGKFGTVCCAQARTSAIDPELVVWAAIRCVPPADCLAPDDDVFCGPYQGDCPAGKTCTKTLGPYTYCE